MLSRLANKASANATSVVSGPREVCGVPTFTDGTRRQHALRLSDVVGDLRREPDVDYFTLSIGGQYPQASTTPYAGIRADYPPPQFDPLLAQTDVGRTSRDGARALRFALDRTLDRLLGAVQCPAVLTGGGLDSGGLLALVDAWAKRHSRKYLAVAIHFEAIGDDRPYLEALESFLGCRVVRVAPEEGASFFRSTLHEGVDHAPLPFATVGFELTAHALAAREGADCLLTGVGGDHLFDGGPRSLTGILRERGVVAAWKSLQRLRGFKRPRHPSVDWLLRPLLVETLPRFLRARIVRTARFPTLEWLRPTALRCVSNEVRRRRELAQNVLRNGLPAVSNADRVLARYRQQMVQASGVAKRVDPYLDPSLKSFVHRLPRHWLIAGDLRRGLFREAIRELIPESLYTRSNKSSFEPAMIAAVNSLGGFDVLRTLADARMLASFDIIEPALFREEFERFAVNPARPQFWPRVWPVLALEAFARHHFGGGDG